MTMNYRVISSLFATLIVFSSFAFGQQQNLNPYKPGEQLTYVGKYKLIGISFTVADLEFKVSQTPDGTNYVINSKAESRGTLIKLFSFSFLQRFESVIDAQKLHILKTVKRDEQSSRIRDSEAVFDYDTHTVTWTETDPTDSSRQPRRVASSITDDMQDIVSAVYMLRTMPMAVGETVYVNVSDSGMVYNIPVKITEREEKKSIIGKRMCFKLEPDIFGEGKFVEQNGKLEIWMTDDEKRIPVSAKLGTKLGSVEISLSGTIQNTVFGDSNTLKNSDK